MTSRWPSVVSRPTFAPLCSSSALVATVVPCTMRSVFSNNAASVSPNILANCSSPAITPTDGSSGVEAIFASVEIPSPSTATRSVKVPPTSMPMRSIWLFAGDEAAQQILRVCCLCPARGLAPAAAAAGLDYEKIIRQNFDADFLGLDRARRVALRIQHVAVWLPVGAAEDAAGAVANAVAG